MDIEIRNAEDGIRVFAASSACRVIALQRKTVGSVPIPFSAFRWYPDSFSNRWKLASQANVSVKF
jgi:hypothetical protein